MDDANPPPQRDLTALLDTYRQGKMEQVVFQAETLLDRHAGVETVYVLLGAAFLNLGQPGRAEETFRRAVASGIREAGIYGNLGMAVAAQGRPGEAVEFYRQAIALDPNRASAHNNLGNALRDCGQPTAAVDAYANAIAVQPDYPDAFNNLGLVLEELGRASDALAAYLQALLGFLHRSLGSFDIDIFGFLGDFGQNRHFGRGHFGKSPENRHIVPDIFGLIPQFTDPESGEKMAVTRQHAELALGAGRNNHIDLLAQQQFLRRHDFEQNLVGHI